MPDINGAAGLGTKEVAGPGAPQLTDKVCPKCYLFMVRWGKVLFCPRCDRANGGDRPGRRRGYTKSPRAWTGLHNKEEVSTCG